MKKVLVLVIDALASRVVVPALHAGRLPTMRRLVAHGTLRDNCLSIFPSITPAATASIATGCYPADHDIAGAFWYDDKKDTVAYFGNDIWVMLREGIDSYLNDFLVRLNHEFLRMPTIYQRIEKNGLTAAVLNFMWFRGETSHQVNAPFLLKLFPTMAFPPEIKGPRVLGLADFVSSKLPGCDRTLKAKGGLRRRYGFHDKTTGEYLLDLGNAKPFPDFTLAYFPNNDFDSHDKGPVEAERTLGKVDERLNGFIESRGGLDAFLQEFAIIICGDHSQGDLIQDPDASGIDLDTLLEDYRIVPAGQTWSSGEELMICPNLRAAHVYLHKSCQSHREKLVGRLLSESKLDQVFWRSESDTVTAASDSKSGEAVYHVATADRGRLSFSHAAETDSMASDRYGNRWRWQGDLSCLDARADSQGMVHYDRYPNAMERIAGSFTHTATGLWVTAHPGYEFQVKQTSTNKGGSHGSLHKDDSTSPLLLAGIPSEVEIPRFPRSIDIAPLCLEILGLVDEANLLRRDRQAGGFRLKPVLQRGGKQESKGSV